MIKIGILDKEEMYTVRLAAALNRRGKGKWNIIAFTDWSILEEYMKRTRLDILAGTDEEVLDKLHEEYKELFILWLREEEKPFAKKNDSIFAVCRYQGAGVIEDSVRKMISQMKSSIKHTKKMVAMYSPVGRCGKTELALEITTSGKYGEWLYIGLEDYSFFGDEYQREETEYFLYFIKEREKEKLFSLIENSSGVIPSAFSPFDSKRMEKEDIRWLVEVLREYQRYNGILFDIGTGILQDFEIFLLFDFWLVPYLPEANSMAKREKLEKLLEAYGMEGMKKGLEFLNMEQREKNIQRLDDIFCPND